MGRLPDPTPGLCDNCGASLYGDYCHLCGQQDRSYIRSVFALFSEFLHEVGNWDSRLVRTLVPLMFRPGYLSTEYVVGRRARYVPPLRLYLFVSLVFFLAVAMVAKVDTEQWRAAVEQGEAEAVAAAEPRPLAERVQVNIPFLSDEVNAEMKRRVVRSIQNPDLAIQQARQLAPPMMFLLLPVFALLLKVLYLFAGRYYTEHLTLALHTHTFLFVAFLFVMALGGIVDWSAQQSTWAWMGTPAGWLQTGLGIWMPVYLFLAQKYFYGQGWFFTTVKFMLTSTVYVFMVTFGAMGLVLLSVMTA